MFFHVLSFRTLLFVSVLCEATRAAGESMSLPDLGAVLVGIYLVNGAPWWIDAPKIDDRFRSEVRDGKDGEHGFGSEI